LLRPDARLAGRPRVAVLPVGLAPVPRARATGSAPRPARSGGAPRRRRDRARLVAAASVDRAVRGPHGGRAPGVRACPDALVLSLPAVVLPLRRVRLPRP